MLTALSLPPLVMDYSAAENHPEVKKEKQMAELNTVMREQVRVMQNEKDKLEREVAESGRQAERSC